MRSAFIAPWLGASEQTIIKVMIAIGIGAYLVLVWLWPYPPILDWPNHMARHYLEGRALAGKSLPSGYEIAYSLMPNLGSDLVVPLLLQIFPLTVASRLFITFNVLICWLGFGLFVGHQAAKPANAYGASVLVLPWLLTASFFDGFLNYTSGLGLAFFAFFNYLRLFEKDRAPTSQLVLHALLIALLYVWHLAALGVYVVLHASHLFMHVIMQGPAIVIHQKDVRKKTFSGLAVLVPTGALFVTQKLTATSTPFEGSIAWRDASEKVTTALAFIFSYNVPADIVVIALWLVGLATMVRVEALRRLPLDWLLVATVGFLTLYIILPSNLGTTWAVDTRALVPLLICCSALIARLPARRVVAGAAIILVATLLRIETINASWLHFGEVDTQHLNFIRQLPVGARILGVGFHGISRKNNDDHVIAWAVPERQAMVSSLFAVPGQQPLHVSVNAMGPFVRATRDGMEFDAERVRAASFDYVWCFNPGGKVVTVPAEWTRVYSTSSITVWKIR